MCKTRTIIVCAMVALVWTAFSRDAVAQPAAPTVHVDGNVNNPGQGDDWGEGHAYKYLQDGLSKAAWYVDPDGGGYDSAEVWVAAAEDPYRPSATVDRDASFHLVNGIELYGGFAGHEAELNDRNIFQNITILSGDLEDDDDQPNGDMLDNCYHVITTAVLGVVDCRIDGFVIQAGNADGTSLTDPESDSGGGMLAACKTIAIVNCTFKDNLAGCTDPFEDRTKGHGAALYIKAPPGTPAEPVPGPEIVDCTFLNNTALWGGRGGGLKVANGGLVHLTNCLFAWNEAGSGEYASGWGGAILNEANIELTNCTLANNTAVSGAGSSQGGGLHCRAAGQSFQATLYNCIFWANVAAEGHEIFLGSPCGDPETPGLIVDYADIQGGEAGIGGYDPDCVDWGDGNLDPPEDPMFGNPSANPPNYRLRTGSPCIDAGDPNESIIPADGYDVDGDDDDTERTPDLDHRDRILHGGDGLVVDMGAYEHYADCVGDLDGDQLVNTADLLILLGNWGTSGPGDLDGNGVVNTADLLTLLGNWGPCGRVGAVSPPQSVQDCISRYLGDPVKLEACIEGMIRAGTP
ncbi:MAG: hypothetical protein SYC29_06655 [Planctomycetota bacterium]|nr:hypothetical protein [Planctomycetota bacterium]